MSEQEKRKMKTNQLNGFRICYPQFSTRDCHNGDIASSHFLLHPLLPHVIILVLIIIFCSNAPGTPKNRRGIIDAGSTKRGLVVHIWTLWCRWKWVLVQILDCRNRRLIYGQCWMTKAEYDDRKKGSTRSPVPR